MRSYAGGNRGCREGLPSVRGDSHKPQAAFCHVLLSRPRGSAYLVACGALVREQGDGISLLGSGGLLVSTSSATAPLAVRCSHRTRTAPLPTRVAQLINPNMTTLAPGVSLLAAARARCAPPACAVPRQRHLSPPSHTTGERLSVCASCASCAGTPRFPVVPAVVGACVVCVACSVCVGCAARVLCVCAVCCGDVRCEGLPGSPRSSACALATACASRSL